ncbi:hypothetical protein ACRALDRAFT_212451 [Sodiomyces alcalophilus JCM 7366]|uniref:uncharacterized protein n=1 Tax=Sodiomyces alcalophilus JCM 7366 TaxID=591952 RepID=UPI0039B4BF47
MSCAVKFWANPTFLKGPDVEKLRQARSKGDHLRMVESDSSFLCISTGGYSEGLNPGSDISGSLAMRNKSYPWSIIIIGSWAQGLVLRQGFLLRKIVTPFPLNIRIPASLIGGSFLLELQSWSDRPQRLDASSSASSHLFNGHVTWCLWLYHFASIPGRLPVKGQGHGTPAENGNSRYYRTTADAGSISTPFFFLGSGPLPTSRLGAIFPGKKASCYFAYVVRCTLHGHHISMRSSQIGAQGLYRMTDTLHPSLYCIPPAAMDGEPFVTPHVDAGLRKVWFQSKDISILFMSINEGGRVSMSIVHPCSVPTVVFLFLGLNFSALVPLCSHFLWVKTQLITGKTRQATISAYEGPWPQPLGRRAPGVPRTNHLISILPQQGKPIDAVSRFMETIALNIILRCPYYVLRTCLVPTTLVMEGTLYLQKVTDTSGANSHAVIHTFSQSSPRDHKVNVVSVTGSNQAWHGMMASHNAFLGICTISSVHFPLGAPFSTDLVTQPRD